MKNDHYQEHLKEEQYAQELEAKLRKMIYRAKKAFNNRPFFPATLVYFINKELWKEITCKLAYFGFEIYPFDGLKEDEMIVGLKVENGGAN